MTKTKQNLLNLPLFNKIFDIRDATERLNRIKEQELLLLRQREAIYQQIQEHNAELLDILGGKK